ncbi:MAG: helix-turn-helix transcriptional regulator [Halobacteriovoraceae bacterium]|jgi:y4mF family transcriptional regulator|nr:helix-turn-helix transcriptional regulator [Halobacteriovoraceae bacterium]
MDKKVSKRRTEKEIMTQSSELSQFIRKRRKEAGLTQEEFSLRVGVGISFFKRLETGDDKLQFAKILQVLDYLGAEMVPRMIQEEKIDE